VEGPPTEQKVRHGVQKDGLDESTYVVAFTVTFETSERHSGRWSAPSPFDRS
jgi:hypothetical protein